MELNALKNKPIEGVQVSEDPNNNLKWFAYINGPEGTPFLGAIFKVCIEFKDNYPFKMPIFRFETRIYHPNIKEDTGEVC